LTGKRALSRWRSATRRKSRNPGNLLFSPLPLPSLLPLTAGCPWVRVVLTPSTVRLGVQDAKATEVQGSDGVFVTVNTLCKMENVSAGEGQWERNARRAGSAWGVGGRCRKGRCVCPVTMQINSQGQCVLQPHPSPWSQETKTLARPSAKQHKMLKNFSRPAAAGGKFFSHCSLHSSLQASPFWPVIWQRTGFLVSGFYLPNTATADSSFTISFFLHDNNRADPGKPIFSIEFGPGWIKLEEGLKEGERRVTPKARGLQWWSLHYKCEAEHCRLEVGFGGRGVLDQPLLFSQPRYQVISSSPPGPALASFRVATRGGGRVVSGCKGSSGQICAPPGGSCSPGFSCRVGSSGQDSGGLCERGK